MLLVFPLYAQALAPRAYVITPVNFNAVTLTCSFFDGGVSFNGAIPVTRETGTFSVPSFTIYHSFGFFGRSTNFTASLPYGVGTFQGKLLQQQRSIYRSGLLDFVGCFSVYLMGGPSMSPEKLAKSKQKVLLGASLKVVAPTRQYDPTKLISWGINWAFKPELGYSERWGNWVLDAYAGAWFYTMNSASYDLPVAEPQSEQPIGSLDREP